MSLLTVLCVAGVCVWFARRHVTRRVAVALLFTFLAFTFKSVLDAGEFRRIEQMNASGCRVVLGDQDAAEDLVQLRSGHVLLSTDPRDLWFYSQTLHATLRGLAQQGAIVAFDPATERSWRLPLVGRRTAVADFHPHGLGLWRDPLSRQSERLFVVNHRSDGDWVEVFEVVSGEGGAERPLELRWAEEVGPFSDLNDVTPFGPRHFFATHWAYFPRDSLLHIAETFGRRRWSYLVRCMPEGVESAPVCDRAHRKGFGMANGVSIAANLTKLYVAASIEGAVHVLDVDPDTWAIEPSAVVDAGMGVDNIQVEEGTGDLIVAGHPKLLTFTLYSKKLLPESPSEIIRIDAKTLEKTSETILSGRDPEFSAASVALPLPNSYLIGAVFSKGILICPRVVKNMY
jgi:hypothetical protein